jgi:hypothetical protein
MTCVGSITECPTKARDVDHHDRASRCSLDAASRHVTLLANASIHNQENSHVEHSKKLAGDTDHERVLTAYVVDEGEGAKHYRDELDNTKNSSGKKLLLTTGRAHHSEVLSSVDGNGGSARLLR